jgi:multidrug resistance efflux pump
VSTGDDGRVVETPLAQRLADFKGTPLTVAVWLAAVSMVVWMLADRASNHQYVGIARAAHYELSPSRTGTLASVSVDLYDSVDEGMVLATLDGSDVGARLETARAALDEIRTNLEATRVASTRGADPEGMDWRADLHRFEADVAQRRIDVLALRVQLDTDRIEAQRLGLEHERTAALMDEGIVTRAMLDDVRLRHETVVARVEANRRLLSKLEGELDAAVARRKDFERRVPAESNDDVVMAPLRAAIEVQRRRIDELRAERERLVLRAPVTGQVVAVLAHTGQAVVAGEPVVTIARPFASEVVGYLPEGGERDLAERAHVVVSRHDDRTVSAESLVLRVSAALEMLPERLWRRPGVPDWGRPFIVAGAQPLDLLPGERVVITPASSH